MSHRTQVSESGWASLGVSTCDVLGAHFESYGDPGVLRPGVVRVIDTYKAIADASQLFYRPRGAKWPTRTCLFDAIVNSPMLAQPQPLRAYPQAKASNTAAPADRQRRTSLTPR